MTPAAWTTSLPHAGRGRLLLAACLFLVATAWLSAAGKSASDLLVQSWDSADGLPAAKIQALAQTRDGYLWVGTSRGLARFDGTRFVVLNTNNTPALGDNAITSLLATPAGELWVGTQAGCLSRRRGDVFEPVSLGEPVRRAAINTLAAGPDGAVWIGTEGAGVARWRQAGCDWFSITNTTNGTAANVTQIITNRQGRLWAVADEQLATFTNGVWEMARGVMASGARQVVGLAPARDGALWVTACSSQSGSRSRGAQLFKLGPNGWTEPWGPYPWRQDSAFTRPAHFIEDRAGRLWMATVGAGMFQWQAGLGWKPLVESGNSALVECSSLAEDNRGIVWVGTTDYLLFQIRSEGGRRLVSTRHLPEEEKQKVVLAVCCRRDSTLWVGTDGNGVYHSRASKFARVGFAPGQDTNVHVEVLYEDRRTNLWAGTATGLFWFDGQQFQPAGGLPALSQAVVSLCEDQRGNLWAGTSAGIVRMGPDGQELFTRNEGVEHYDIRAIEEDRAGQLWAAIGNHGLYRKTGGRFEHYGAGQWRGETRIRGLLADSEGALWITTDGMGLARLKDGRFDEWTAEDGLPTDDLVAAVEDTAGNLWFSSANGIFGCPKTRLLSYQRGASPPIIFWQLSTGEGLESRRCSGGGQPSVARNSRGDLWFPNWHTVAGFDPVVMQRHLATRPLPPIIEEAFVDGVRRTPDADGVMRVSSGGQSLEFHYTNPEFRWPERLEFRYRLGGLDRGWVYADRRRTANYTHLPAGRYEFQVMGCGADGEWQVARQPLRLQVVPRFWERRPLQAALAAVLLAAATGSAWSISRLRLRRRLALVERQRALEQERSRIARDMHDEIGARLTQISLLSALAGGAGDAAEVRAQTGKISSVATSLTRSLDEIVWAVRPQNDNLESLVDYLRASLSGLCENSPVRFWFSGPAVVPEAEVPASVRHNIMLACSEAVNNTLKHSGASEVHVRVRLEAARLEIEIADNGRGFDVTRGEAKQSGLVHIRQRIGEIGGTFACNSAPGEGTRFLLTVPMQLKASAPAGA